MAQLLHAEPVEENVPGAQAEHTAPSKLTDPAGEDLPAGQDLHELSDCCFVSDEYLPAVQSVHTKDPLLTLYLPAKQSTQVLAPSFCT